MSSFRFLILLLFLLAGTAHAEQGCPDGFIPNAAGTPGVPCVAGSTQNWGELPRHAPSRWGAFAGDSESGKIGQASGMPSKRKAEKQALAHCRSKGGQNCKVEITYNNQCGVVAYGGGHMNTASAATIEEASDIALRRCNDNAQSCKIYFSDCSYNGGGK
ncbi:DUF4189 domain-containing protein [Lysobacter enzymogenes]|uniref:DUF4189 domain-containing protein n=1 Tax=Lysobacter enzymogenes TaxID=69 RepID=UPI00384D4A25